MQTYLHRLKHIQPYTDVHIPTAAFFRSIPLFQQRESKGNEAGTKQPDAPNIMSIKYSLVQRKDLTKGAAEGSKLFYAQAVSTRKVAFNDLCEEIAETCTLTSADIKAVLDRMIWVMVSHLKNSEIIEFAELGNFRMTLGSSGTSTPEEFKATLLRKPKVSFYPGKRLQNLRTLATFSRIDEPVAPPTDVVP